MLDDFLIITVCFLALAVVRLEIWNRSLQRRIDSNKKFINILLDYCRGNSKGLQNTMQNLSELTTFVGDMASAKKVVKEETENWN